jgi:hypothetical protein
LFGSIATACVIATPFRAFDQIPTARIGSASNPCSATRVI